MVAVTRKAAHRKPRSVSQRSDAVVLQKTSTLAKWGNSLGLRIPQEGVRQLGLQAGEPVAIEIQDQTITIRPVRQRRRWTLDDLLKGVTPAMVGGELDWGGPVGKELL